MPVTYALSGLRGAAREPALRNRAHRDLAHHDPALASAAPGPLTRWDFAGMLAGFLLTLAITCVNSRGRIFWEDEMLGWLLLRDPSWHHMIAAWQHGADGGGFSFYLLGRAWFAVFGASDLSFRLFSSTAFGLGFAATWAAARRIYPVGIVAFAVVNTWFFSPPYIFHMTEGRFYGLLVMSMSIAIWLAIVASTTARLRLSFYLAVFLAHGLLTTSHVLGVVFSASVLAVMVATDLFAGRFRWPLYLSAAAAWLLLFPERAGIVASAQVGKPHFWTVQPTFRRFLGVYSGFSAEIAVVLLLLVLAAAITLLRRPEGPVAALRQVLRARAPIYVLSFILLLVPLGFLLEGRFGTPLFNNRYLLPITIALAYVTAELLQLCNPGRLFQRDSGTRSSIALWCLISAAYAAFVLFWVFIHLSAETPGPIDYTNAITSRLPHGIPVVCEDAFSFTELLGREHDSGVRYEYLLDWKQSVSPAAPLLEVTQYHLMENWRNVGYFSDRIEYMDAFLRENSRFLVLHSQLDTLVPIVPEIGNPLTDRFATDKAYQVQPYTTYKRKDGILETVSLVCRGGCNASASTR